MPGVSDSPTAEGGQAAATEEATLPAEAVRAGVEPDRPMPEATPEESEAQIPAAESMHPAAGSHALGPAAEDGAGSAANGMVVDEQQDSASTADSTRKQTTPTLLAAPAPAPSETSVALTPLTTPRGSHLEALSDDEDDEAAAPLALASAEGLAVAGSIEKIEAVALPSEEVIPMGSAAAAHTTMVADAEDTEAGGRQRAVGDEEEAREEAHALDEDVEVQLPAGPRKSKEEILMQIQVCCFYMLGFYKILRFCMCPFFLFSLSACVFLRPSLPLSAALLSLHSLSVNICFNLCWR